MKLSEKQKEALQRVGAGWGTAYDFKLSLSTLRSLVRLGLFESRGEGSLGSSYSPRTTVEFRQKAGANHELS